MTSKVLKPFLLLLISFTLLQGCCDKCEEEKAEFEKENIALKDKLEKIENEQTKVEVNQTLKKYEVEGFFSLRKKKIYTLIPVTEIGLKYQETRFIKSPNASAMVIRIDNEDSDACTKDTPILDYITVVSDFKDTDLSRTRLSTDKKLMVIVFNGGVADFENFVKTYRKNIDQYGYDMNQVLIKACSKDKEYFKNSEYLKDVDILKPNEDGGDIIIGG